tara:strand:- start:13697 stop:14368 length:672 start_codon:yes stop_codon:yes gene_type:complete
MFKVIMIGSTGATGCQLLKKLINDKRCESVTTIGRRPALNGKKNDKLLDIILKSLSNLSSTEKYWQGKDVFFNCIGTTRKRAGGAKEFIDIEAGISYEAAKMASKAKIPHASLISAKGANHKAWATNWIHPLLYIRTMGEKEETIQSKFYFEYTSIFKPGMLIRLKKKQSKLDFFFESKGLGLGVDKLADAMILDAERVKARLEKKRNRHFIGNKYILSYLKI